MDRFLKIADLAQVPFTIAAYVGAAYAAYVFLGKYGVTVPWQIIGVIGVIVLGLGATAVQVAALKMVRLQASGTMQTMTPSVSRSPLPPIAQTSDRIFVTATPAELVKPFESYVAAQANRLVEPYIGKWIRLSATVVNVHNQATFWQVLMYRAVGIGTPDNPQISALFEPEWSDRLSTITLHQSITIIGRIQQVERITVSLAECELV